jgi:hypothetical protein
VFAASVGNSASPVISARLTTTTAQVDLVQTARKAQILTMLKLCLSNRDRRTSVYRSSYGQKARVQPLDQAGCETRAQAVALARTIRNPRVKSGTSP